MNDRGEHVPSLEVLEDVIWKARNAKEGELDNWQHSWIEALETLATFLAPWGERPEPLTDRLDQAAIFVSMTIDLLRDERNGARPHFWNVPQNRPPKTDLEWDIASFILTLVGACRERERRTGGNRDPYEIAQAELRARGKTVGRKRLRSVVSNASRMPEKKRGSAEFGLEALSVDTFDPNILIDISANFLARQKGSL